MIFKDFSNTRIDARYLNIRGYSANEDGKELILYFEHYATKLFYKDKSTMLSDAKEYLEYVGKT